MVLGKFSDLEKCDTRRSLVYNRTELWGDHRPGREILSALYTIRPLLSDISTVNIRLDITSLHPLMVGANGVCDVQES